MFRINFIIFGLVMILSFCYSNIARAQSSLPDFVSLAQKTQKSYMNIYTKKTPPEEYQKISKNVEFLPNGSGFVVSKDGYIVTNYHVVKNNGIKLLSYENVFYDAKLVGFDEETDIAVLKIDTDNNLFPVVFSSSNDIKIGEWVLTIGNPFGVGTSFSQGIVSAKNRKISSYDNFNEFIQTDVNINQGNSGGPLFNLKGDIIGVNSILFSKDGIGSGVSFAIPSNIVSWIYNDIVRQHDDGIESPKVLRGTTKIKFQNSTDLKNVIISGIEDENIGILEKINIGDIIIKLDEIDIIDASQLNRLILQSKVGSKVIVIILENNIEKNIELEVFERQSETTKKTINLSNEIVQENYIEEIGIEFIEKENKMYIKHINNDSEAFAKGLSLGSLIMKIDKKDISSIKEIKKAISEAKLDDNRPIILLISNKLEHNFVSLRVAGNV